MALTVLQGALRACCQKKNVLIRIFAVVLLLLLFQKLRPVHIDTQYGCGTEESHQQSSADQSWQRHDDHRRATGGHRPIFEGDNHHQVSSMHSVDETPPKMSKLQSEDRLNCREQVQAEAGKSVVLPCIAEPQQDLRMVHWKKGNETVCLHRTTSTDPKVHPDYKGRAFLFNNNFTSGNCSMKLSEVKQSDNGTYTCIVSFIKSNTQRNVKECSVTLLVTSPPHSTTPSHHGPEGNHNDNMRTGTWNVNSIAIAITIAILFAIAITFAIAGFLRGKSSLCRRRRQNRCDNNEDTSLNSGQQTTEL